MRCDNAPPLPFPSPLTAGSVAVALGDGVLPLQVELPRPEFMALAAPDKHGKRRYKLWVHPVTDELEPRIPRSHAWKLFVTLPTTAFFVGLVVLGLVLLIGLRTLYPGQQWWSVVMGLISFALIKVLTLVYAKVCATQAPRAATRAI